MPDPIRRWTAEDLPDLRGRIAVVTGANSGLGYHTALELGRAGARVVLACRDLRKASEALAQMRAAGAEADFEVLELDLASLASVRSFAKQLRDRVASLELLINNAGVMAIPYRTTQDGFEMQLGTNHLGHFALTGLLLEPLLAARSARVVTVSSTAHRIGRIRFDDLHGRRSYRRWPAYGQSKLANLLFTYELQRRLDAAGKSLLAVASHPGWAATNLQTAGAIMDGSGFRERAAHVANALFAQSAAMGALPTLYAATSASVRGGEYFGPDRFMQTWGHPRRVGSSARSRDADAAARLWQESERATGVRYEGLES
jgi:NAD(P)-dependent dehydrogenase (short-subunit alcohol dehydrogenase family)